VITNPS